MMLLWRIREVVEGDPVVEPTMETFLGAREGTIELGYTEYEGVPYERRDR
jgi:hypothetical protein